MKSKVGLTGIDDETSEFDIGVLVLSHHHSESPAREVPVLFPFKLNQLVFFCFFAVNHKGTPNNAKKATKAFLLISAMSGMTVTSVAVFTLPGKKIYRQPTTL